MKKEYKIDLTLPIVAWLSGGDHEPGGDRLICRSTLLHTPTTGIVEVLPGHTGNLGTNLAYIEFQAEIITGTIEKFTAILLNYPVVCEDDRAKYEEDILKPVSQWFAAYMKWTKDATDEMSERLEAGDA